MQTVIAANVLLVSSQESPSAIAFNADSAIIGGKVAFFDRGVLCSLTLADDSEEEMAGLIFNSASILACNWSNYGGTRQFLHQLILP